MPRTKRITRQNHFHHVMFRGINGENVFLDDRDRSKFCLLLQEACEKHFLDIHGFCLMDNHIHFILEPTISESLQMGIHAFTFRYAQYYNKRHNRRGYLFQGRFRSIIVEGGIYLWRLIRYIHLNPIEAGIVQVPERYKWSSYRAFLGLDHFFWLKTERVLKMFAETNESAILRFVEYTQDKSQTSFDLEYILKASKEGIFGAEEFTDKVNGRPLTLKNSSEPSISHESLEEIFSRVCVRFNLKKDDLSNTSKLKSVVDARSILSFIVRKSKKWSLEELGNLLNKNSGTLSRLATRAEQQPHLLAILDEFL